MIKPDAVLRIERVPLERIQVKEYQERYPERVLHYVRLLKAHPGQYAGLISLVPSDTHEGMLALLDGYNRLCAYIIAGRPDALALIIEE